MKSLIEDLKKALDALAYADLGELKPQDDKEQLLHTLPPATALQQSAASRQSQRNTRRVVLALGESLRPGAMKYAVNTCQRMKASLDVLCVSSQHAAEQALKPHLAMLRDAQVACRIVVERGPLAAAVARHTQSQAGTLLVVAGAEDEKQLKSPRSDRSPFSSWKLEFPLVVVMDNAANATTARSY